MSQQDNEGGSKPGAPRLGRRLTVLKLAVVPAAAAVAACVPAAGPVYTTGITDADPVDAPGAGRGGFRRTGITDSDPVDAPGAGRGGRRRIYTGLTDRDPSDSPGYGRGW
jgi:hypothetical protein